MNIEALHTYVLPELPGAPDVLVSQALLLATIEFCVESLAWELIQDPVSVLDKQNELDVEVPRDARIVLVKDVWMANRRLLPVTMAELQERLPDWQTATGSDPAYYNASIDWKTIRIFPSPLNANRAKLTMRVALAPELAAKTIPDELGIKYLDALCSGAKARLMLMPDKAWSNAQVGMYHRRIFDDGVTKAKVESFLDRVQGQTAVRPVAYGHYR